MNMPKEADDLSEKYDSELWRYFKGQKVRALVGLQVRTERGDELARELVEEESITALYMVTGDVDILMMVEADDLQKLSDYIIKKIAKIDGVLKTKSMLILTSYKENDRVILNIPEE